MGEGRPYPARGPIYTLVRATIQTKIVAALFAFLAAQAPQAQDSAFNKVLSEVQVKSSPNRATEAAVSRSVRGSHLVSDGVSVEFLKRTPDRTLADALRRVSGLTVQGDRFVLVRGLADRYNSATLNRSPLPSTEPDRRAFSFDLIPTSLIDNVIVAKSPSANLPGDWSGGLVQVTTRDAADNSATLSLGVGAGSLSTLRGFELTPRVPFPSSFPTTNRFRTATTGDRRAYTKLVGSPGADGLVSPPNLNGSLTAGLKRGRWSATASAAARGSYQLSWSDRQDYQSSTELAYRYRDTMFSRRTLASGMLNVSRDGRARVSLKSLVNYQAEESMLRRSGDNWDNMQSVRTSSSNHLRTLVAGTQADARLGKWEASAGHTYLFREQPDYRVDPTARPLGTQGANTVAWRDTYRFWSVMDENGLTGSVTRSVGRVRLGAGHLQRYRHFEARVFRYQSAGLLDEVTNNTDRYSARFGVSNAWAMVDTSLGRVRVNAGVRAERNSFSVRTADFSGAPARVDRLYLDVLPSVNLSVPAGRSKVRLSASRTLARPEMREVANLAYYDFVRNAQVLGNPALRKTDVANVDARWERWSDDTRTGVSAGAFAKAFRRPIEQVVADGSVPSNLLLTFSNPDRASLVGVELDGRLRASGWLDLYLNGAVMSSRVNVAGGPRRLQGQSGWVVNAGANARLGRSQVSLAYNRAGDRISAVGFQGYPDVIENSRDVVDLVWLVKMGRTELKLAASDLLAQPSQFYQATPGGSRTLISTNNERTLSATINIKL